MKDCDVLVFLRAVRAFPPQKCGGLIEGSYLMSDEAVKNGFPRRNAGASLKARTLSVFIFMFVSFPPQKCGGLIEGRLG